MEIFNSAQLKGLKAVIYTRKSTESEDRQVASLESQLKQTLHICDELGLFYSKQSILQEAKSAKDAFQRPIFNALVESIKKGDYQVIACWHPNRLSRNATEAGILIDFLSKGFITAIVTPQQIYLDNSSDIASLYNKFSSSHVYVKDLSVDVKRGQQDKVLRGWMPGKSKIGYINKYNPYGEPTIEKDEVRFNLLRKSVDLFMTRSYSVSQILDILNNEWGFRTIKTKKTGNSPLAKSTFYKFLRDPYYFGMHEWAGNTYKIHESIPRMITEEEYWVIQDILGDKGRPRPSKYTEVPYRGLIKCGECGSSYIPYVKNKKLASGSIKPYSYARCNHDITKVKCTQKQLSINEIDKQVKKLLEQITISEEFSNWAISWIKQNNEKEQDKQTLIIRNLEDTLEKEQAGIVRLTNLYTRGSLNDIEEYDLTRKTYEDTINDLKSKLEKLKVDTLDWMDTAIRTFEFTKNAKLAFEKGTPEQKTKILRTLGANFYILDGKLIVDLIKPFIVLKNSQEIIESFSETSELDDLVMVGANKGDFEHWFLQWSGWADSNRRPHGPKPRTLPTEPHPEDKFNFI